MGQYSKKAFSHEQMLSKLENQGLCIPDKSEAIHYLKSIGYFRLSAYFLPFINKDSANKVFKEGVELKDIEQLYAFDKELRLLVVDAIESIEVTLRASLNDYMSFEYGPHWYLEAKHFNNLKIYQKFLEDLEELCRKPKEVFLIHYYANYTAPKLPPSWMVTELISFGTCANLFKNLHSLQDRKEICKLFKQHPTIMSSWFTSLNYVRNLCAHHARLWNRWFVISPMQAQTNKTKVKPKTFAEQAYIIDTILKAFGPDKSKAWKLKLYNLFLRYPKLPVESMGFKHNWKHEPFWSELTKK